jgi:hypothetical protein
VSFSDRLLQVTNVPGPSSKIEMAGSEVVSVIQTDFDHREDIFDPIFSAFNFDGVIRAWLTIPLLSIDTLGCCSSSRWKEYVGYWNHYIRSNSVRYYLG